MPSLSDFDISLIPTERVAAVVIKSKLSMTPQTRQYITDQWEQLMKKAPGLPPCIVLDGGLDIQGIAELPDNA